MQSQTAARREEKCRAPTTNQNTYMVTRLEVGFTDRPRYLEQRILPMYYENFTPDFVLHSSRILGCGQKCRIEPTRHPSVASSRIINNASPPMMSKVSERKTNRRAHNARDQTKQGIQACFQKEEKRGLFSN